MPSDDAPIGIYLRTERGIGALENLTLTDGPIRGQLPAEPIVIDDQGAIQSVNPYLPVSLATVPSSTSLPPFTS